jgi:cytochrome c peroxidase
LACVLAAGCDATPPAAASRTPHANISAQAFYQAGLDSLAVRTSALVSAIEAIDGSPATAAAARQAFAGARTAWKRIETQAEYYSATAVEPVNGPSLEAEEEDDPRLSVAADGFQGIEEGLYPEVDPARRDSLLRIASALRAQVPALKEYGRRVYMTDATLLDAMRQELVRIEVLTLAGFDSPVAHRGLDEAVAALSGLRDLVWLVAPDSATSARATFLVEVERAARKLKGADWDSFDRLAFYRTRVPPLSRALAQFRAAAGIAPPVEPRIWRAGAASVFEAGAFDPYAPSEPWVGRPDSARIEQGRRLFFDLGMSGSGVRSCSTCHQPARGFTDGLTRSAPLSDSSHAVLRNAPTLINSGLQTANFYDLRAETLEGQVGEVVRNREEMHGDPEVSYDVRRAIAAYVRSLTSLDSRFDRYVRGENVPWSDEERLGFNLFMGKGLCGTCHFAPLFNGTVPPAYTQTESEVIGVPSCAQTRDALIDPDVGRIGITRRPTHRHAFKTPTLRNVELTAPYMHNGVYRTLEDVLDFYNRGGGAGIGSEVPNQTLPFDKLDLTPAEQRAIISFLRTLTDTAGLGAGPVTPRGCHCRDNS